MPNRFEAEARAGIGGADVLADPVAVSTIV
jgi:hypothetical protein